MISLSDTSRSVLSRSFRYTTRVESWLGATLLNDNLPVETVTEEVDRSLTVPEMLTLTVPRVVRGTDWAPNADDHPLGCNGQRLRVLFGIGEKGSEISWYQRGWYLIQDSTPDSDIVTVDAVGLLALIDEARLVSPLQPTGTMTSMLRSLIEPAVTVVVDAGLTDRAIPSTLNFDDDRLQAVLDLMDAWAGEIYTTADGYLSAVPAMVPTVGLITLTNGIGGTVVKATGKSTRDGAFNVVVARGQASDGGQVQGVAYDMSGPKAYGGLFNPLPVPYFFNSPLLTTVDQCTAAAQTVLARLKRQTSQEYTITCVPDPSLQAGDPINLVTDDFSGVCTIEALSLPFYADGGAMTLKVRSTA